MKLGLPFALFFFSLFIINGQVPDKLSYQALIRDADGSLIANSEIAFKVRILEKSINGTITYEELHNANTNQNGLVTLQIGTGTSLQSDFSEIDWSNGPYFMETQLDLTGGSNFTLSGVTELLSVPYALYAKTAGSIKAMDGAYVLKSKIILLQSSRSIAESDIGNTIECTGTGTLTIASDFNTMNIGDFINLEAHNGATLTIHAAEGVNLNYTAGGKAIFKSVRGTVRFGLLRKSGNNAYIISGQ